MHIKTHYTEPRQYQTKYYTNVHTITKSKTPKTLMHNNQDINIKLNILLDPQYNTPRYQSHRNNQFGSDQFSKSLQLNPSIITEKKFEKLEYYKVYNNKFSTNPQSADEKDIKNETIFTAKKVIKSEDINSANNNQTISKLDNFLKPNTVEPSHLDDKFDKIKYLIEKYKVKYQYLTKKQQGKIKPKQKNKINNKQINTSLINQKVNNLSAVNYRSIRRSSQIECEKCNKQVEYDLKQKFFDKILKISNIHKQLNEVQIVKIWKKIRKQNIRQDKWTDTIFEEIRNNKILISEEFLLE